MYRLSLCALVSALLVGPVAAGTVTVDFTVGGDSKIAVPDFMTWRGDTYGRLSNEAREPNDILPEIHLYFAAGDSPLTLTATAYGLGAFVGPGCNVDVLTENAQQIICTSATGQMDVWLQASNLAEVDPPWVVPQLIALDDLTITGDDVDQTDMVRKNASTPEPSSIMLAVILAGVGVASFRRYVRA